MAEHETVLKSRQRISISHELFELQEAMIQQYAVLTLLKKMRISLRRANYSPAPRRKVLLPNVENIAKSKHSFPLSDARREGKFLLK
ncbi:MAG: hypothetical protein CMJ46_08095 [Planctomyces sp.]|nr:hypothetical protein [Planctomyces sp.]